MSEWWVKVAGNQSRLGLWSDGKALVVKRGNTLAITDWGKKYWGSSLMLRLVSLVDEYG